jgi:phenylacetate-CoA ligase
MMEIRPWLPSSGASRSFYDSFESIAARFHSAQLPAAALADWRTNQLRRVVSHVKRESPFYRKHLQHVRPEDVDPGTLKMLPFTTKSDLRESMMNIVCGDPRRAMVYYHTSATTGPATPCPRSVNESLASNYHVTRGLRAVLEAVGHIDQAPIIGVMAPNEVHSSCKTMFAACQDLDVMVVDMLPLSPMLGYERCLRLMQDLKVDFLVAPISAMMNLARFAHERGWDTRRDFGVKAVLNMGEVCSAAAIRNVSKLWGCQVINFLYGSQEAFVIGVARADGRMLPSVPNYIFEILDPDDSSVVTTSGRGELCVTNLIEGTKPLIRYRTGDYVELDVDDFDPSPSHSTIKVLGRVTDRMRLGGRAVVAMEIEDLLFFDLEDCTSFQLVLRETAGREHLHVRLEGTGGFWSRDVRAIEQGIVARIEDEFGISGSVETVTELDVLTSMAGLTGWKAARLVDERPRRTFDQMLHDDEIEEAREKMAVISR